MQGGCLALGVMLPFNFHACYLAEHCSQSSLTQASPGLQDLKEPGQQGQRASAWDPMDLVSKDDSWVVFLSPSLVGEADLLPSVWCLGVGLTRDTSLGLPRCFKPIVPHLFWSWIGCLEDSVC